MPSQTRWLDDEEQELWRLLLGAVRKINRGMDETLKAGGEVSASEFAVLVALSEAPEQHLRLHELCTQLEWDRSRASHQVTRMEKRGLLYKEPDAVDARGINVCVTHVGLEHLRRAAPEHVESVRRMVLTTCSPRTCLRCGAFLTAFCRPKTSQAMRDTCQIRYYTEGIKLHDGTRAL